MRTGGPGEGEAVVVILRLLLGHTIFLKNRGKKRMGFAKL